MATNPPTTNITSSMAMGPVIKTAEGEKFFTCQVCKRVFNKKANLKVHSRKHTGEKPYACSKPGCGRSFMWKSSVTFHEQHCQVSKQHQRDSNDSINSQVKGVQKRPKNNSSKTVSSPTVASSLAAHAAASLNISAKPGRKKKNLDSKSSTSSSSTLSKSKKSKTNKHFAMRENLSSSLAMDTTSNVNLPSNNSPPNSLNNTNNIGQGVWSVGLTFNLQSAPSSSSTGSPSSLLSPPPPPSSTASLLAGGYNDITQLPAPSSLLEKRMARPSTLPKPFYSGHQQQQPPSHQNIKDNTSVISNASSLINTPNSTATTATSSITTNQNINNNNNNNNNNIHNNNTNIIHNNSTNTTTNNTNITTATSTTNTFTATNFDNNINNNNTNSRPLSSSSSSSSPGSGASGAKPPVMHTSKAVKMPKMPITMDLDESDDEGGMKIIGAQDTFFRTGNPFGGFAPQPRCSPLPVSSPIVCGISPMPLSPLAPFSPLPPDSPAHNAPNPVHPPVNQSFTRPNSANASNVMNNSSW